MKTLTAITLLASLLLPLSAAADDARCRHTQPRELRLDLDGIKTVTFEIGPHKLRLDATGNPDPTLRGRACAASAERLSHLQIEQEKTGDRLLVRLLREDRTLGFTFGNSYAYLDLSGQVPDDVLVQLKVGSGDAWLTRAAAMSADVGSGDVDAKRIRGQATVKVGSGDIVLDEIGSLNVPSIGSGDVTAKNVRGTTEVGSIGSGDFTLVGAGDGVRIGSIGSGDATLRDIQGDATVGSIGSGDLVARDVRGNLTVRSKGSGDISHSGVSGTVDVPRRR